MAAIVESTITVGMGRRGRIRTAVNRVKAGYLRPLDYSPIGVDVQNGFEPLRAYCHGFCRPAPSTTRPLHDGLNGPPGPVRTANPRLRRPVLYPIELLAGWCGPPASNRDALRRRSLNPVRLPVPPGPQCGENWCERRGSNSHAFRRWLLRPVCLPNSTTLALINCLVGMEGHDPSRTLPGSF